ncbi:hypothetical protein [Paenibacillus montanisoli]|uniref:hypothetical protein n=1 Tax=Paenibacillus montanisoli TaxID=2081970 RepID=UPI0010579B6B|nr:hypothetical protein [Paenibacillus montanisoli]
MSSRFAGRTGTLHFQQAKDETLQTPNSPPSFFADQTLCRASVLPVFFIKKNPINGTMKKHFYNRERNSDAIGNGSF